MIKTFLFFAFGYFSGGNGIAASVWLPFGAFPCSVCRDKNG